MQDDQFLQEGDNETDILFVVDNSCSMGDDQADLAANFGSFLSIIDALGVDFHIGVVTMDVGDAGQLEGAVRVITPSTPDPQGSFSANANVGENGSGIEQGFHTGYLALSSPNTDPGGANDGFLREAVGLRVVFVSDEPEQSGSIMSWSREDYVGWFQALKPNLEHVVLSSIIDPFQSCEDPSYYYSWAAMETGGACSYLGGDWIETLNALAWQAQSAADTFELSSTPVENSVGVRLNGVDVYVGWIYRDDLNAGGFDTDHVLDNGDLIKINYAVAGTCTD